jgi:peptidoglycan/xylan/chitin deacetylase (PgdA/CDA1 family)
MIGMQSQSTMKRALKCAISLAIYAHYAARNFLLRMLRAKRKGTCVILYYHSVPPEQRAQFAHQLDVLIRRAKPVRLSDAGVLKPGINNVVVTFDDAFENFAKVALLELAARNIPSTVFVIADALGKAFGPEGQAEKVMSVQQIQTLPVELVTIGSHTMIHPFLPSLSEPDARREIGCSREKLEKVLKREIVFFSFPYGGFDRTLVKLCREAGYQRAFTTLPRFAFEDPDEFVVGRVKVDPTDWPIEFRLNLAGAYRWLPTAFSLKKKFLSSPIMRKIFDLRNGSKQGPSRQSKIQEMNEHGENQSIRTQLLKGGGELPVV